MKPTSRFLGHFTPIFFLFAYYLRVKLLRNRGTRLRVTACDRTFREIRAYSFNLSHAVQLRGLEDHSVLHKRES